MAREAERNGPLLHEVVEEAVGFGGAELRLTRDLLLRPRRTLDAYDAHGGTAGGLYPKPLRYYLTLNGVYLLLMAVTGGFEQALSVSPGSGKMLADLARFAGKSLDETRADLDQWFALFSVPIYTLAIAGPLYLLIRRWSPADNRTDFHQTFTFLNLWTLYQIPLALVAQFAPGMMLPVTAVTYLLAPVVYAIVGRGRWWRTRGGAVGKGALLTVVTLLLAIPGAMLIWAAAILALKFLP